MPGSKHLPGDLSKISSNDGLKVCLMRHGRILGKGDKRFIGQTDLALNPEGIVQAESWKPVFDDIGFERIYVSGLLRTHQTADHCCPARAVIADERLNEIHLGAWENLSFDLVKQRFPDAFDQRGKDIYRFHPPGGESFEDVKTRVMPFFETLFTKAPSSLSGPVLVITHSGVIRLMACLWAGISFSRLLEFRPEYGQVFILSR